MNGNNNQMVADDIIADVMQISPTGYIVKTGSAYVKNELMRFIKLLVFLDSQGHTPHICPRLPLSIFVCLRQFSELGIIGNMEFDGDSGIHHIHLIKRLEHCFPSIFRNDVINVRVSQPPLT